MSLDLVQEWLAENAKDSIIGGDLSIRGIATYQPFDGLMEMKVEMFNVLLSGFVVSCVPAGPPYEFVFFLVAFFHLLFPVMM